MPEFEDEDIQLPPHSIEAEQAVIGSALVSPISLLETSKLLKPIDFYNPHHQIIWSTVLELWEANKPVDIVTVSLRLKQKEKLDKVGGRQYITDLAMAIATTANAGYYAEEIQEFSKGRRLAKLSEKTRSRVFKGDDPQKIFADLIKETNELEFRKSERTSISVKDIMPKAMEKLKRQQENKGMIAGVPTGLWDLDTTLFGLKPGNLVVVAARPSMGKTALALNIARNVTVGYELPVLFLSLEMGEEELALRLLCSQAGFDANKFNTGEISEQEIEVELKGHANLLANSKLDIVDETHDIQTVEDIQAIVQKRKTEGVEYGLIIIDYLQLMEGLAEGNRANEVAEVSRKIKKLAGSLGIPIVALSQVSRACEARPNKRPTLADLRESGAIEQDASVVMFIYRDDFYNKESTDQGMAEIIIAKNRNGPVETIKLRFRPDRQHFESLSHTGQYIPRLAAPIAEPIPDLLWGLGLEETLARWEKEGGGTNVTAQFNALTEKFGNLETDAEQIHFRNFEALSALWESRQAAQVVQPPATPVYADLDIFNE